MSPVYIYIYHSILRRKREERNPLLDEITFSIRDGKLSVSSGEEKVWTISFHQKGGWEE